MTKDKQHNKEFGKLVALITLALILVLGWSQNSRLAWAQGPAGSEGDVSVTTEPVSPLVTPTPTLDDGLPLTPPARIILTVEPVEKVPPTAEPQPTGEPDDVGVIIDPPNEEEIGEPVKDDNTVAKDDRQDATDEPIDIFDLAFVASRYGSNDPAADVNLDGTVDIFDLSLLAAHYGQTEPGAGAVIVTPEPEVAAGGVEFGEFAVSLDAGSFDLEAQYYVQYRPLRIGVSTNYFKVYDATDYNSAPDAYASIAVGGVPVRTPTMYNTYQGWPYWRLGWWRYASYPWVPAYTSEANYYSLPINIELRDDDGYVCYGYYGCRYQYQLIDISPGYYTHTKSLTLYPSACMITDEVGTRTYGSWLSNNRCRVPLQTWGQQWPRGYVSYYVDVQWD